MASCPTPRSFAMPCRTDTPRSLLPTPTLTLAVPPELPPVHRPLNCHLCIVALTLPPLCSMGICAAIQMYCRPLHHRLHILASYTPAPVPCSLLQCHTDAPQSLTPTLALALVITPAMPERGTAAPDTYPHTGPCADPCNAAPMHRGPCTDPCTATPMHRGPLH